MADINLIRIREKLNEQFSGLIDMKDLENKIGTDEYNNALLSRSYAAYAVLMLTGVDFDVAAKSITDGYHDNGIDAIYNDEINSRLILVQSKWSNDGNGTISLGDFLKFTGDGVEKILGLEFESFNDKIKAKREEITSAIKSFDYTIELVLAFSSNQELSNECKDAKDRFLRSKNDGTEEMIHFTIITKAKTYDSMSSMGNQSKIDVDEVCLYNWGPIEIQEKNCGYYGTISARLLAEWYNKYGLRLFEKNIRLFKGDTEVNKGIQTVLEQEPENFYLFNNGIKIIADRIKKSNAYSNERSIALLKLEGVSIVNGAQTTGSIFEFFKKKPENLEQVKIHVQLIELESVNSYATSETASMEERITKLSNTQNRIENKDFATQDKEQERIRRDLAMDGIEYSYKPGTIKTESLKSCNLDDATISLGCFYNDVSISSTIKRAYGSIFDDLSKPPYKQIFNPATNVYELWNGIQIYRALATIENHFQNNSDRASRLISIHGNRFILHMIYQKIKDIKPNFSTLYFDESEILLLDLTSLYAKIVSEIADAKQIQYPDAYPANVFKNNARCKAIKETIKGKVNN